MSMRRHSLCLVCQARHIAFVQRRRRRSDIFRRSLQTSVSVQPEDDGFLVARTKSKHTETDSSALAKDAALCQWKLYSPIDDLREAALGFDALCQRRDLRLQVLRNLSNPWPPTPRGRQPVQPKTPYLPEVNAAVIPHEAFRLKVKQVVGFKAIRQLLRQQLLRCERPREILRVVAVAMQNKNIADNLALLHEPIMRALYRCRQQVSDPEVLKTLNIIITRFRYTGIHVEPILLFMALKFAARSRSLPAMKRHLKTIREQDLQVTSNVFRSVIAKFSIGHRGLGEIRNGRWKRRDLLQVLTGFEDAKHLSSEQQYHFGSFLDRNDWQYLHGWVAVLARCKDHDTVWREWELWKASEARTNPKALTYEQGARIMTSRLRGDYWFLEQMTYSGDWQKAWKLFEETGIPFHTLKDRVKDKLLENVEYATRWDDEVQMEMIKKYDRDLQKIEAALGVKWVPLGEDGEGQHELFIDQEEALDKLGGEDWRLDNDYGYPWETSPIVPEGERGLHEAVES